MHKPAGVKGVLCRDDARARIAAITEAIGRHSDGDDGAGEAAPPLVHEERRTAAGVTRAAEEAKCNDDAATRTLGDIVPEKWLTGDLGCYGRLDLDTTGLVSGHHGCKQGATTTRTYTLWCAVELPLF